MVAYSIALVYRDKNLLDLLLPNSTSTYLPFNMGKKKNPSHIISNLSSPQPKILTAHLPYFVNDNFNLCFSFRTGTLERSSSY